ncbi:galactokinase [Cellulomonas rhizosphaerae]|uniref:Galactokinase n=1 Tax=Cellulomonas rhizosphaerae TaxID=2293719 RepID=A0A413RLW6_9CELL|nr:galactokinase [Cellulomonas rhizosphaerae]RHA41029.1 galactokinase [Cellulomonas rhizosphaerae]
MNQIPAWTAAEGAERARTAYRAAFGAEPAGVWAAPGRVNLIGEHTDYNGGLCLPIALAHRTYVALSPVATSDVTLTSQQESDVWTQPLADIGPGRVDGWPGYAAGVSWALAQDGHELGGYRAAVDSCVPYGAGLSSSAALESAFAVAVDEVFGLGLGADHEGRRTLIAACIRAENEVAGANTGGMDQSAALLSRDGTALLLDMRDGSLTHIPFDLAADGLALLVIDTRAPHQLVDGQYGQRRATCEAAAARLGVPTLREVTNLPAALAQLEDVVLPDGTAVAADVVRRRVRHVVTEIGRVEEFVGLLTAGRVREVGAAMDASHASLRDDYEVSCAELDVAVEAARAAGAHGARMTGGGFGGSAIALVEADQVASVSEAVRTAFAERGWTEPGFLAATGDGAASRVDEGE